MGAHLKKKGREEYSPATGTLTDRSGSIASAGVSQMLMDANPDRAYWFLQNLHATAVMWVNHDTAAVAGQPSIRVGPMETYTPSFICVGAIHILSTTEGATFTSKEG